MTSNISVSKLSTSFEVSYYQQGYKNLSQSDFYVKYINHHKFIIQDICQFLLQTPRACRRDRVDKDLIRNSCPDVSMLANNGLPCYVNEKSSDWCHCLLLWIIGESIMYYMRWILWSHVISGDHHYVVWHHYPIPCHLVWSTRKENMKYLFYWNCN